MIGVGLAGTENWLALFEPDERGPWAVRYNWIKHRENDEFLSNYFSNETNDLKLNLRNLTKDLAEIWKPHNDTLARAETNGDMIFRIKTLNQANQSIDHLEVWKSREHIDQYFHTDNELWPDEIKLELRTKIRERGFIVCPLARPYPLISKTQALQIYRELLVKAMNHDNTRVESKLRIS